MPTLFPTMVELDSGPAPAYTALRTGDALSLPHQITEIEITCKSHLLQEALRLSRSPPLKTSPAHRARVAERLETDGPSICTDARPTETPTQLSLVTSEVFMSFPQTGVSY